MRARPRVSVIVVSYFVRDEVRECLRQLRRCTLPLEVFVVDNASADGTLEMLREEFAGWDGLHVIALDRNIGLAAANNLPIPRLAGDYVMILNPDTLPGDQAVNRLVSYLDAHPDVGVVGPKQLYGDGTPHSTFHSRWGFAHIALLTAVPRAILKFWYDRPGRLVQREVAFVSGACLMIRSDIYRAIGGYDPYYFITIEDVADLCRRVRASGHRIMYLPEAVIVHYGARSSSHARASSLLHSTQGHLYYLRKWGKPWSFRAACLILFTNSALRFAAYALASLFNRRRFWPYVKIHTYVMRNMFSNLSTMSTQQEENVSQPCAAESAGRAAG
jgi:N-acetylglucosaminyl-diphospho-decaprenol L-rhamnosyltransferase